MNVGMYMPPHTWRGQRKISWSQFPLPPWVSGIKLVFKFAKVFYLMSHLIGPKL